MDSKFGGNVFKANLCKVAVGEVDILHMAILATADRLHLCGEGVYATETDVVNGITEGVVVIRIEMATP